MSRILTALLCVAALVCTRPAGAIQVKVSSQSLERTQKAQLFGSADGRYYLRGDANSQCYVYAENPHVSFVGERILAHVTTQAKLGKVVRGTCLFPYGTILINVLGCLVIGYFGTLTLQGEQHAVSDDLRLFVMVGLCGGFTTFSSFSLQTYDLLRAGAWGRALANIVVSVVLCLVAVAAGHLLALRIRSGEES